MKSKSKSRGQVTYWEDTVKSCSTPFKPLKIGSLIIKLRQVCQLINQSNDTEKQTTIITLEHIKRLIK